MLRKSSQIRKEKIVEEVDDDESFDEHDEELEDEESDDEGSTKRSKRNSLTRQDFLKNLISELSKRSATIPVLHQGLSFLRDSNSLLYHNSFDDLPTEAIVSLFMCMPPKVIFRQ